MGLFLRIVSTRRMASGWAFDDVRADVRDCVIGEVLGVDGVVKRLCSGGQIRMRLSRVIQSAV